MFYLYNFEKKNKDWAKWAHQKPGFEDNSVASRHFNTDLYSCHILTLYPWAKWKKDLPCLWLWDTIYPCNENLVKLQKIWTAFNIVVLKGFILRTLRAVYIVCKTVIFNIFSATKMESMLDTHLLQMWNYDSSFKDNMYILAIHSFDRK